MRLERLVVATDGEPTADAALNFAKQLAERDGAEVQVVAVLSPRVAVPAANWDPSSHRRATRHRVKSGELQARVERQVRDRIGVAWPVQLKFGHVPWVIADVARSARADLVLVGHPATGAVGLRRPGRHTAEQVACISDIPVIAVKADVIGLPRLIVAVVDGTEASDRAERVAASLLAPTGTFLRVTERLTRDVESLATSLGAELLSVPLRGASFEVRVLMSAGIVNALDHATCSVLVTPDFGTEATPIGVMSDSLELTARGLTALPV